MKLDGWQLTLPVADPDSGDADTVNPAKVSPPWLTTADGGGVTFWAPVDGATTKNSSHARTELVQRDNFAAGSEPHTLTASATVTQLPSENPDVILGQIHGAEDIKSVAWVMLHYFDGAIKVVVKQAQSGSASQDYVLADSVPLNTPFTFRLSDNGNGTLTFGLDAERADEDRDRAGAARLHRGDRALPGRRLPAGRGRGRRRGGRRRPRDLHQDHHRDKPAPTQAPS